MNGIEKEIIGARPSLREVLPVVFWQTAVFAALNVLIAIGLVFWMPPVYPWLAPNEVALNIWAGGFALIGVLLAQGLVTKRWERLRALMMVGFSLKVLWSLALFFRVIDGGSFLTCALFVGLAALQSVIIIFYLPPDEAIDDPVSK